MADNTSILITVDLKGAKQSLRGLQGLTKGAASSIAGLANKFLNIRLGLSQFLSDLQPIYAALIGSNEQFTQNLLNTQTALASQFRLFRQGGEEITDLAEKITASEASVRKALIQLEEETRDLSGVTTAQTTEAFNIVVSESGRLNATLDEQIELAKGLVATLGATGLPLQQARQEFRALVQGDLNNQNAQLIKQLGVSEAEFREAERKGELTKFLASVFDPAVEANKRLTELSPQAAATNILDTFEVVGRTAGEGLTKELARSLNALDAFLFSKKDEFAATAEEIGNALVEAFRGIEQIVQFFGGFEGANASIEATIDLFKLFAEGIGDIGAGLTQLKENFKGFNADPIGNIRDAVDGLLERVKSLNPVLDFLIGTFQRLGEIGGQLRERYFGLLSTVKEVFQNISDTLGIDLAGDLFGPIIEQAKQLTLLDEAVVAFFQSVKTAIDFVINPIAFIVDSFKQLRLQVARTTGELGESREALATYGDRFDDISSQVDKFRTALEESEEGSPEFEEAQRNLRSLAGFLEGLGDETGDLKLFTEEDAESAADLRQQIGGLVEDLDELGIVANAVEFQGQAFQEFGTAAEEVDKRLESARERLEALLDPVSGGGRPEDLAQLIEEIQTLTGLGVQVGGIDTDQAIADLQSLLDETNNLSLEQQVAVQKQINELVQAGSAQRQAAFKAEQQEIATLAAQGQISSSEAQIRNLETQREDISGQIQDAQKRLAAAQALAPTAEGNAAIKALQDEIDTLNGKLEETNALVDSNRLEQQISRAERAFAKLNAEIGLATAERERSIARSNANILTATANSQAELAQRQAEQQRQLVESEQQANRQIIEALRERVSQQQAILAQANPEQAKDIEQELLGLQTQLAQAETQTTRLAQQAQQIQADIASARVAEIDERIQIAQQGSEQQQVLEDIAAQQRINSLQATEEEITLTQVAAARERAENAARFAQERLDALRALPIPEDEAARLDLEANVREATLSRYQAELSLLQAVGAEDKAIRDAQVERIQVQIDQLNEVTDAEQQRFDLSTESERIRLQALQRENSLIDSQLNLEQARRDLQRQTLELKQQELQEGRGLLNQLRESEDIGERQRRLIEQRLRELGLAGKSELAIAREVLDNTIKQNQIELEALEAKQQAERRSLELKQQQEESQRRLAIAEQRQALLRQQQIRRELELEVAKAELIDDPALRARTLENLARRLDIQDESVSVAQQSLAESQTQLETSAQQNQLEREALNLRQQAQQQQAIARASQQEFQARLGVAEVQDSQDFQRSRQQAGPRAAAFSNDLSPSVERITRNEQNVTNNVVNNFNAPLANASLARTLGI